MWITTTIIATMMPMVQLHGTLAARNNHFFPLFRSDSRSNKIILRSSATYAIYRGLVIPDNAISKGLRVQLTRFEPAV